MLIIHPNYVLNDKLIGYTFNSCSSKITYKMYLDIKGLSYYVYKNNEILCSFYYNCTTKSCLNVWSKLIYDSITIYTNVVKISQIR